MRASSSFGFCVGRTSTWNSATAVRSATPSGSISSVTRMRYMAVLGPRLWRGEVLGPALRAGGAWSLRSGEQALRGVHDPVHGEPQLLVDPFVRRAGAEPLEAEHHAVVAHPAVPGPRVPRLDRHARDAGGDHRVAIRRVLPGEQLVRGHADHARPDAGRG